MMELQEAEEEEPGEGQRTTYPHTPPNNTYDTPHHSESWNRCPDCKSRMCSCALSTADDATDTDMEETPDHTTTHTGPPPQTLAPRRSTRPKKAQQPPEDPCLWRRNQEQGSFCPSTCQGHLSTPCSNQIPTWTAEAWVHLKHRAGF